MAPGEAATENPAAKAAATAAIHPTLNVEQDVQHVPVLHYVLLTLAAQMALLLRLREGEVRRQEAADFFQRGRAAEAAGKANVARIYYQMAARRLPLHQNAPMKTEILARLDLLDRSTHDLFVKTTARGGP